MVRGQVKVKVRVQGREDAEEGAGDTTRTGHDVDTRPTTGGIGFGLVSPLMTNCVA